MEWVKPVDCSSQMPACIHYIDVNSVTYKRSEQVCEKFKCIASKSKSTLPVIAWQLQCCTCHPTYLKEQACCVRQRLGVLSLVFTLISAACNCYSVFSKVLYISSAVPAPWELLISCCTRYCVISRKVSLFALQVIFTGDANEYCHNYIQFYVHFSFLTDYI